MKPESAKLYELLRRKAPVNVDDVPRPFVLYENERLKVVWAPFDTINAHARLAIVGITPGWQQTRIAYAAARETLLAGRPYDEASRVVASRAAFAGTMRKNLITMLDDLEVGDALGIGTVASMFGKPNELLHTTSALRYPTFVNNQNYSGHSPRPQTRPFLRWSIEETLSPELSKLKDCLVVPLGKPALECVKLATSSSGSGRPTVLEGFPHPSGANAHRVRQFEKNRGSLSAAVQRFRNGKRPNA